MVTGSAKQRPQVPPRTEAGRPDPASPGPAHGGGTEAALPPPPNPGPRGRWETRYLHSKSVLNTRRLMETSLGAGDPRPSRRPLILPGRGASPHAAASRCPWAGVALAAAPGCAVTSRICRGRVCRGRILAGSGAGESGFQISHYLQVQQRRAERRAVSHGGRGAPGPRRSPSPRRPCSRRAGAGQALGARPPRRGLLATGRGCILAQNGPGGSRCSGVPGVPCLLA